MIVNTNPTMSIALRPEAAWSHISRLYELDGVDGRYGHNDKTDATIRITRNTRQIMVLEMTVAAVEEMIEDFSFIYEHGWADVVRKQVHAWQW